MGDTDFSSMSAQGLVEYSENNTKLDSWQRQELYSEAFKKYKAEGNNDQAVAMHNEALLYEIAANDHDGVRFHPQSRGKENGIEKTYPDWDTHFTVDVIDYYKKRVEETTNSVLKARYADLLWERGAGHTYGRMAARAYLDAIPHYYQHNMILEFGDALKRSLVLGAKSSDKMLVQDAINAHHHYIRQLVADKCFRPLMEVADSLIAQAPKNKGIDLALLAGALEASIEDYATNDADNYIARQVFYKCLTAVRSLMKDNLAVTATKVAQAEAFVEEAEFKGGAAGGLVPAHFYAEALQIYITIGGHTQRADELKVLIQQANEAGRAEFTTTTSEASIPASAINDRLKQLYAGYSATEIFQTMTRDPQFILSWEDAYAFAVKAKDNFSLQFAMPIRIMRPGNIVVKILTTDEEKIEYKAIEYFQQSYHSSADPYLRSIFDLLKVDHPNYSDELAQFFGTSEVISTERIAILRHGLRAYGQQEYVAAIHVLVFQIEGILRDMLGLAGLPTWTTYKRDTSEMRARTLDDILEALGQIKGVNQDFLKFVTLLLNNLMADNIRNDIAHALMPVEAFQQQYAELLLLVLIKLTPYAIHASAPTIEETGESTPNDN